MLGLLLAIGSASPDRVVVHNLGGSCGYSSAAKGLPHWPPAAGLVALIAGAALLTAGRAAIDHRPARAVAGYLLLGAVLSGATVLIASLVFLSSHNCFD